MVATSWTTLPSDSDQRFDFRPWARCPGQENTGKWRIILGQWTRGPTGNRVSVPEDVDSAESKDTKVGGVALLRLKLRVQRRMLGERTEKEEVSWARTADLGLKPREPSHQ